jgi:hypothetical protein
MNPKLEGFPSCYVINLEEAEDRRAYMKEQFAKHGIKNYHIKQFKRFDDANLCVKAPQEVVDVLALGLTTSHLLMIKWWYENRTEDVCAIMEDDCDFDLIQHWNFKFSDYIRQFGPLWDAIQLSVVHEGWPVMAPRVRDPWDHGLQCYIIKRHYAKKIVEYYFNQGASNIISIRMVWCQREPFMVKLQPTPENIVLGLGHVYTHPIFNHNVHDFKSMNPTDNVGLAKRQHENSESTYVYVKEWWEKIGTNSTLEQLFDYEYCCPAHTNQKFMYIPIDV